MNLELGMVMRSRIRKPKNIRPGKKETILIMILFTKTNNKPKRRHLNS